MRYYIDLDIDRCIACGACTVACMDQNDIDLSDSGLPLRRCVTEETGRGKDAKMRYLSISCMHCDDAPCIEACPFGCISRDEETGFVLCDNSRCVGCRKCVRVCAVSAPVVDRYRKMHKCDGCNERVKHGLLPACVKVCPMSALELYPAEEYQKRRQTGAALYGAFIQSKTSQATGEKR